MSISIHADIYMYLYYLYKHSYRIYIWGREGRVQEQNPAPNLLKLPDLTEKVHYYWFLGILYYTPSYVIESHSMRKLITSVDTVRLESDKNLQKMWI